MLIQSLLSAGLGVLAGIMSGVVGIGGGIILVPALVFVFGLSQHQAQGTTLALLVPPIGFMAAWTYWKQGYVDIRVAALICIGFILGSFFGAKALNRPVGPGLAARVRCHAPAYRSENGFRQISRLNTSLTCLHGQ